jgi:hypothetical protein
MMSSLGIYLMDLQEVQKRLQHTVWQYAVHVYTFVRELRLAESVDVL